MVPHHFDNLGLPLEKALVAPDIVTKNQNQKWRDSDSNQDRPAYEAGVLPLHHPALEQVESAR